MARVGDLLLGSTRVVGRAVGSRSGLLLQLGPSPIGVGRPLVGGLRGALLPQFLAPPAPVRGRVPPCLVAEKAAFRAGRVCFGALTVRSLALPLVVLRSFAGDMLSFGAFPVGTAPFLLGQCAVGVLLDPRRVGTPGPRGHTRVLQPLGLRVGTPMRRPRARHRPHLFRPPSTGPVGPGACRLSGAVPSGCCSSSWGARLSAASRSQRPASIVRATCSSKAVWSARTPLSPNTGPVLSEAVSVSRPRKASSRRSFSSP